MSHQHYLGFRSEIDDIVKCLSYERCYKILLENMIRNDMALKANLEGVELLIFPSNRLPEKSQRKDDCIL